MSLVSTECVGSLHGLSHTAFQALCVSRARMENIPAIPLYLSHYKSYPNLAKCSRQESNGLLHVPTMLNYLNKQFGHDPIYDITSKRYHKKSKTTFVQYRLCDLGNGIMIYFSGVKYISDIQNPNNFPPDASEEYFLVLPSVLIYYLPENDIQVQNMTKDFQEFYIFESKFLKLHMVCRHRRSTYCLRTVRIKTPMIFNLGLHYGENFVPTHEKILEECSKKEGKGIILLHGIPGSDAENIVRDRNDIILNTSQAVANLLNLSDGLLGDAMHMQIIATFNGDLTIIDKALLRKGRLIAEYKFDKLDIDNAKKLSNKLGFGMEHISTSMTLAEIYNQNEENEIELIT